MRKGKAFCPYVGWRKEKIEQLVASKVRNMLVRLILNGQIDDEFKKYRDKQNQSSHEATAALEAEIHFLTSRIKQMEKELADGRGKSFYSEVIAEMQQELRMKHSDLSTLLASEKPSRIPDHFVIALKEGIRRLIALLEEDSPSPQSLRESVYKFIPHITSVA